MAKRQRRTRFTEEIIVLHSENDEFKVHLHFLTARSAFFRDQAEIARRNGIGFTDEDDVVAAYVHFVYHGEILTELSEAVLAATEESDGSTIVKAEHDFLAKLYIFGEKVKVRTQSLIAYPSLYLQTSSRTTPSATKSSQLSPHQSTDETQKAAVHSPIAKS